MNQHSAEIRWFFPISEQAKVKSWFLTGAAEPDEKDRADRYLNFAARVEAVGVKLREGKLEVKAIAGAPALVQWGPAAGRMDHWVKWSVEAGTGLEREGDWRKVVKTRWLRKYSLDRGFPEPPQTDRPAEGCNLEFTVLKVNGEDQESWCSIGFEAFGKPDRLETYLQATVEAAFSSLPPQPGLIFDLAHSASYPVWLNQREPPTNSGR